MLGKLSSFASVVTQSHPDCIVVGLEERRRRLPIEDLLKLRFSGTRIEEAATTFQNVFSRVPVSGLTLSQLIFLRARSTSRNLQLQTIYSTTLTLIGLTLAAPVMLLVALVVKLTSPRPVLYRQARVVRSMVVNAATKTGAVWATRDIRGSLLSVVLSQDSP